MGFACYCIVDDTKNEYEPGIQVFKTPSEAIRRCECEKIFVVPVERDHYELPQLLK